ANMKEITEKRDPRILIAALVNMAYNYSGGYIRDLSSNDYLTMSLGGSGTNKNGNLRYYNGNLQQYYNGWATISNSSLLESFKTLYEVIGQYSLRIFRTHPTITKQMYDIVCATVTFTDSNAPAGYQTVEGGITIHMYNGSDWEMLQESTHSLIENLKGYVRAVAYQRAGDYSTAAGFITSTDWATLFAKATDADGNKIAEAHMTAFVTKNSQGVIQSGVSIGADQITFSGKQYTIDADHINFVGKTVINNKFTVDANGNVTMNYFTAHNATIDSGRIGGFKISGNGLTNVNDDGNTFTNDALIILRNDTHRSFVGIGPNVLPAYSTARATARFEIEDTANWFGYGKNSAVVMRAKNADYNYAFVGEGNGLLNGAVDGFKLNVFTPSSGANQIPIAKGNRVYLKNSSMKAVYLPTLAACRTYLDINSSTYFALELIIMGASGASGMVVYGYRNGEYNDGDCPHIRNNDSFQDVTDGIGIAEGDILHLILVYDGSAFNAYMISHRD
ncbi:MAG: hypothetical protein IJ920_09310, partial [Paludibacteraceae bacterium]|nr:hypothetical protein [Paludibacteraceae bacterium]